MTKALAEKWLAAPKVAANIDFVLLSVQERIKNSRVECKSEKVIDLCGNPYILLVCTEDVAQRIAKVRYVSYVARHDPSRGIRLQGE